LKSFPLSQFYGFQEYVVSCFKDLALISNPEVHYPFYQELFGSFPLIIQDYLPLLLTSYSPM